MLPTEKNNGIDREIISLKALRTQHAGILQSQGLMLVYDSYWRQTSASRNSLASAHVVHTCHICMLKNELECQFPPQASLHSHYYSRDAPNKWSSQKLDWPKRLLLLCTFVSKGTIPLKFKAHIILQNSNYPCLLYLFPHSESMLQMVHIPLSRTITKNIYIS